MLGEIFVTKFIPCCTQITGGVIFRKWGGIFIFLKKAVNYFRGVVVQREGGFFNVYWIVGKKYWLLCDIYTL